MFSRRRPRPLPRLLLAGVLLSLVPVGGWMATGRHVYTKFEVVENVEAPADPDDPLAGTGFYDDDAKVKRTVRRDEFHLGLLPAPQGILDKHWLSVSTTLGAVWVVVLLAGWRARGRKRTSAGPTRRVR